MKTIILSLFLWISVLPQSKPVYVISLEGAINPVTEEYLRAGLTEAIEAHSQCLVVRLNTPGGLLSSTRDMVSAILRSPLPVIIYVAPEGAQAASAGVFITLSAHVAVMTPGTNIGAAHPVTMQGQADSIMMEKATNDAAAFIKSISEKRNRNVQWAEDAVRKSLSVTETEALKLKIIDLVSSDIAQLLKDLDGRQVQTVKGTVILRTAGAKVITREMNFRETILQMLSNPEIAYILLMLGIYGLMFELYNPGAIFPGVVGFISLILALYSLHTMPVNYAGAALIILAVILFILEIKIISHGLLSIGGALSLFIGSMMLFKSGSLMEVIVISKELIVSVVLLTLLFFLVVIGMGVRAQRLKTSTGAEGMIGESALALEPLRPNGRVQVHGEIWFAESLDGEVSEGERVVVTGVEELKLKVGKSL